MSLRLKNYETVDKIDFRVNLSSRNYLSQEPILKQINEIKNNAQSENKNNQKVDESKTLFNPLSSYEDVKLKNSKMPVDLVNNNTNVNFKLSNNFPNQFSNSMPGSINPRPPQNIM